MHDGIENGFAPTEHMTLAPIHNNLVQDEYGIWRTDRSYSLSYPDQGNARCLSLEDNSFWFRHRNDCITAAVHCFPPTGNGPIVDVGGGNGFTSKRLDDEGFEVMLVEPGPAGAFNAKTKRKLPEVICASLKDAGFAPNSLPAVGLFDVLEHIEDDTAFLRQVHDTLAPSGLLYATVPAHQWLWSVSDVIAGHHRRYSTASLGKLLSGRLKVLYVTHLFAPFVLPALLLRCMPWRLGLSRVRNVLSRETEHGTRGTLLSRGMTSLLQREVPRIRRGRKMYTGTSLLVIARKR